MKALYVSLLIVLMFISPSVMVAGGPAAEIDAHVNGVQVGDDFITFALYGEVRLHVMKPRKELEQATEGCNARGVALRFENRYLVVHRPKEPVPGVTVNWDELKERATSVKGKDVFFQVWGAKTTIEGAVVTRIDAANVSFMEKDKG